MLATITDVAADVAADSISCRSVGIARSRKIREQKQTTIMSFERSLIILWNILVGVFPMESITTEAKTLHLLYSNIQMILLLGLCA